MSSLVSMAGFHRLGRRMIWSMGSLSDHPSPSLVSSSVRSADISAAAAFRRSTVRVHHRCGQSRSRLVAFYSTTPSSSSSSAVAAVAKAPPSAAVAAPENKNKQQQKQQGNKKQKGGGEKGSKNPTGETTPAAPQMSYYEQKAAAKDHRRALYDQWSERRERLKTRRAGRPRTFHRNEFRSYFIPQKVDDEYHERKARQAGLEWELTVAAIVQRPHVVQPDREPWEIEMEQLQTHLSQYGKRYPKELVGDIYPNDDTYQPLDQDALLAQLPFQPGPRETAADVSGDIRTLDRKLKTAVYLFVKHNNSNINNNNNNNNKNDKTNNQNRWEFPSVTLQPDELLLDGAKRALQPYYGLQYWCPSNAPWAVQVTPFLQHERQQKPGLYGQKTFFVLLQYDAGAVPDQYDYGWLDRDEITQRVAEQQQGQQQPSNNKHNKQLSKLYHYML